MNRHLKAGRGLLFVTCAVLAVGCRSTPSVTEETAAPDPPSILLVTLDTTRADRMGFESPAAATPSLDAIAARGVRFSHAYTTAPMTLPAHASMLTGLYPSEHGVHENARFLAGEHALVASRLKAIGYTTAAVVSGMPLSRQFGLARGFDRYDDDFGADQAERRADETTDRAVRSLEQSAAPLFLWVHYFDPHDPYDPPEPYRSRYLTDPYVGEIAAMDAELGRLIARFEERFAGDEHKIIVAGDHGEGLGEEGEALHGNLLSPGVMRVPLVIVGSGIAPAQITDPVSVRRIFDTILGWAGEERPFGLLYGKSEVVMAEAMKPYLQYGWQPQVMAIGGGLKAVRSGAIEVFDLETGSPVERAELDGDLRQAIRNYPLPSADPGLAGDGLTQEERERLASLGYVAGDSVPTLRENAPSPTAMTALFSDLDVGAAMFVRGEYERAIPVFSRVLEQDPENLMVTLRLAVAHSILGQESEALARFARAETVDASSLDLRLYLGLHHLRFGQWEKAEPLLEGVLIQAPERLPALEAMARIREQQGRLDDVAVLLERIVRLERKPAANLVRLGRLRMGMADTPGAIDAFERARSLRGERFECYLELGVCYLADRRFEEARASLDGVPPSHPGYPMALFKRAQVSVLLGEPDRAERIRQAARAADETTRPLIANEPLFAGYSSQ